ncbi:hypothetical protein JTB14_003218 [Gonioctena quinquepunctata]|nr:hypothetical protein JTB14_003218 [Gonioctena quinquepunctata]
MEIRKCSVVVDESTDISQTKTMEVVVRMNDELSCDIIDQLLCLPTIEDSSALGLTNFFVNNEIPYKDNMIDFAADGTNVMMGKDHYLQSLLKRYYPDIFVLKCTCHSLALIASHACEKLPTEIENLATLLESNPINY